MIKINIEDIDFISGGKCNCICHGCFTTMAENPKICDNFMPITLGILPDKKSCEAACNPNPDYHKGYPNNYPSSYGRFQQTYRMHDCYEIS